MAACALVCVVLIFSVLGAPATVQAIGRGRVLVLHSYSPDFGWTKAVTQGLEDLFNGRENPPDLLIEYMTTKRQRPDDIAPALRLLYAMRYGPERPDVIVASDNNALDFLLDYRDELFPNVPVVFCGVNQVPYDRLAGVRDVTGVIEEVDFLGTLEAAIDIWPEVERVAVVADDTGTSRALLEELDKVKGALSRSLEFLQFTDMTARELGAALNALPNDSVVLLISFFRDRNGLMFSDKESGSFVSGRSGVPAFVLWDALLGSGLMGGHVVSGYDQGKLAGEMALTILGGAPASSLPIQTEKTRHYVFDQHALERFGIPESRLPTPHTILNRPKSLYSEYRELVLGVLASAISLVAVIAALLGVIFYRRRSERFMRESEGMYRGLFEASRDGIALANDMGVVEAANPALLSMLGLKASEAVGLELADVFGNNRQSRELVERIFAEGFAEEQSMNLEREQGGAIPSVARGWLAPGGKPGSSGGRLHVLVRDVTESRRAEELLLESERRLRTILDYAYDWEYWIGSDGRLVYTSPACERITGYSPGEFMADSQLLLRISHPEDRDKVHRHMEGTMDSDLREFDFRIIAKNGEERWIGHVCQPVFGHQGRFSGRRASNRDITAYKRAEQALAISEERLQLALHSAHEGVWDWNLATGQLYFGPRYYTMLGYAPEEFEPTREAWMDQVHIEDRGDVEQALNACTAGRTDDFEVECRMRTKERGQVWVLLRGKVVSHETQDVEMGASAPGAAPAIRMVGTITDIGARKAMEEQLLDARMQAEQASMAKSEFLANMSHEIRTPISGILGVADMLSQEAEGNEDSSGKDLGGKDTGPGSGDDQRRERLNLIRSSARSLLRIIDDILDLSRIEAGRMELRSEPFLLPQLLKRIGIEFRHKAEQKGIVLEVGTDIGSGISAVPGETAAERSGPDGASRWPESLGGVFKGDAERLLQVLRNLVGNAFKYTESGWIKVRAQARQISQSRAEVEFTVRDTGIGMPSEETDAIFESFTRVEAPYVRRRQGTGLGLAICRQLVHCMNGSIRVTSSVGEGTLFTVLLPLEIASSGVAGKGTAQSVPLDAQGESRASVFGNGAESGNGNSRKNTRESDGEPLGEESSLRILLAEDNAVNLMFIKHFLEQSGHEVTAVMNGVQALDVLGRHTFDLILMDVQMPEMDGLETTRAIRAGQVERCPAGIPVVALTAYAMKGDRESFMEAGMNGYVSKPVNIDELMDAIRAAVRV